MAKVKRSVPCSATECSNAAEQWRVAGVSLPCCSGCARQLRKLLSDGMDPQEALELMRRRRLQSGGSTLFSFYHQPNPNRRSFTRHPSERDSRPKQGAAPSAALPGPSAPERKHNTDPSKLDAEVSQLRRKCAKAMIGNQSPAANDAPTPPAAAAAPTATVEGDESDSDNDFDSAPHRQLRASVPARAQQKQQRRADALERAWKLELGSIWDDSEDDADIDEPPQKKHRAENDDSTQDDIKPSNGDVDANSPSDGQPREIKPKPPSSVSKKRSTTPSLGQLMVDMRSAC